MLIKIINDNHNVNDNDNDDNNNKNIYLDFWKPGWQKYQLILLLGNLKQQNSFKGRLKAFIWRRAVS